MCVQISLLDASCDKTLVETSVRMWWCKSFSTIEKSGLRGYAAIVFECRCGVGDVPALTMCS